MPTKKQFKYNIGDRIAERPKPHALIAVRKEVEQTIAQYRSQRYGTIVGFKAKLTTRGAKQNFALVQWDHLKSPTEHALMRICPIDELDRLTKQTIVPSEAQ